MNVPSAIRVFGKPYRVFLVDDLKDDKGNDLLGQCDNDQLTIKLAKDQPLPALFDTLIHEINHAIWWTMGIAEDEPSDLEEHVVQRLSTGFAGVLLDNPSLCKLISQVSRLYDNRTH